MGEIVRALENLDGVGDGQPLSFGDFCRRTLMKPAFDPGPVRATPVYVGGFGPAWSRSPVR
jgi:hypothetical protein